MMTQITPTAIACVLENAVKAIRKFGVAVRNRCPWVSYINQFGKICSHFIARAKFSGYHFKISNGAAVVTNLETGKQYSVLLTATPYCNCEVFKYAHLLKPPCKHIKMVASLQGNLEQILAQHELELHLSNQSQDQNHILIDENNLPHGCFLTRTDDDLNREYFVFCHAVERVQGQMQQVTKSVGRIIEGLNGIGAYRLHSGIYRSFASTYDAAAYLVGTAGLKLNDVANAYEGYLDEQF